MSTTPTDGPPPAPPSDPQPGPGPGPGPRPRSGQRDLGGLRRSSTDRYIAGVAGGLARHFDIDPIIVRVALVVLVFFGGAGLLVYGAAWLLVPQDDEPTAVVALDERSRSFLLYIVGAVAVLMLLGQTLGHFHTPWPVLIIALIVVVLIAGRERLRAPRRRPRSPEEAEARRQLYAEYAARTESEARARADAKVEATLAQYLPTNPPMGPPRWAVDPRKCGPVLFWFTVALVALAEGVLGIVDMAGADVAPPAYAALAVGIIGLMLVVGAFWGRAGGLIFLGLVASLVLAGSLAANKWQLDGHSHSFTYTPLTAAAIDDTYRMGTGDLHLDLSHVSDPATLAGRTIDISGHVGTLEVIAPDGIAVDAHGSVRGPGSVQIFGVHSGGINVQRDGGVAGPTGAGQMTISAELNVGKIIVETSDER